MTFLLVLFFQRDQQNVQPSFQYHAHMSVVWFEYWYVLTLPEHFLQFNEVHSDVLSFDSVVSTKEARANLKERVLMGNVNTYALEFGAPEQVKMLTKECVRNVSDIISPACGLEMK